MMLVSGKEILCSAYRQCPQNIVTEFVHDEKTRVGCLVLYKAITTLYSSTQHISIHHDSQRDIKGRLFIPKPTVVLEHKDVILMIEN